MPGHVRNAGGSGILDLALPVNMLSSTNLPVLINGRGVHGVDEWWRKKRVAII